MRRRLMHEERSMALARAVMEELRWDPRVDAERIVVSSDGRTILLTGAVRSFSEKCCTERIAREIRGVAAVENALEVRLSVGSYRTDAGLERLIAEILENHTALSDPLPRVRADRGWLTLDGVVASEAQKRAVEESLREVAGVRGITNNIEVAAGTANDGVAEAFEAAVRRRAALIVEEFHVEFSGRTMTLYGRVGSCVEHDALIDLASRRRGVARVEDRVLVQPPVSDPRTEVT
jgi:osmotically-inducible protein OsmY